MLVCDYIVEQIDGDYAHLKRVDQPEEELKVVARALLPAEIYEGCELHYELDHIGYGCTTDTCHIRDILQPYHFIEYCISS